eukprot:12909330-Alexandrium_andersonii.AAC.1
MRSPPGGGAGDTADAAERAEATPCLATAKMDLCTRLLESAAKVGCTRLRQSRQSHAALGCPAWAARTVDGKRPHQGAAVVDLGTGAEV